MRSCGCGASRPTWNQPPPCLHQGQFETLPLPLRIHTHEVCHRRRIQPRGTAGATATGTNCSAPDVHDVGVDSMRHRDLGPPRARPTALGQDLRLQFWLIPARRLRLLSVPIVSSHSLTEQDRYRRSASIQDGFAGRTTQQHLDDLHAQRGANGCPSARSSPKSQV
jgi:hypothetical protein